MYEPFWEDIYKRCKSQGVRIRSIWAVDKSDHAASGMLNEQTQGDDPSFSDLALDLLNMVNLFRDQMTLPIVGVGHSMGATALLELSTIHPRLFASVIAIDPIIGPQAYESGGALANMSVQRKDLWPSREKAEMAFRSAKALKTWDSKVMDRWLEYGLRNTPTLLHPEPGKVTLATTKAAEAWNYSRPWFDPLPEDGTVHDANSRVKYPDGDSIILQYHPFYRPEIGYVWDQLPRVQPSVLYLFPAQGPMSIPEVMDGKVTRTGTGPRGSGGQALGRVKSAMVEGSGHLAPFEKPDACARAIAEFLAGDLEGWRERRDYEREHRDDKSINRVALSDEFVKRVKAWSSPSKEPPKSRM